jgi:hypothetical protein
MKLNIAFLIILIFFVSVAYADVPDPLGGLKKDTAEAGANMIKSGIDAWLTGSADSMIGYAHNVSGKPDRGAVEMTLFSMITFNYDPFKNPAVINVLQYTSLLFIIMFIMFVLGGMGYVMIHSKFQEYGEALDFALHMDNGFNYKDYIKTIGGVVLFLVFGFSFVWTVMLISHVFSEMMAITALDATVISPSAPLIYFFMGIAYLILSIFMAIRVLVISIVTSLLFILFALWSFHIIRDIIIDIFIFFVMMIFLQPILISIAAIGIMTIDYLRPLSLWNAEFLYFGLLILLLVTALVFTVGFGTVRKLIKIGVWRAIIL